MTILSVLAGRTMNTISGFRWSAPWDAADFGRCARLIDLLPEWEGRLEEVSRMCPKWTPIVANWSRLKALYDTKALAELDEEMRIILRGNYHGTTVTV